MKHPLVGIVIALVAGYGLFEAWPLLSGPRLLVHTPSASERIPGGIVTIAGSEKRAVALTVDGNPVLPDENGTFSETVAFPHGTSILTVTATDRFGRTASETRTLFVP